ncbi:hypothetical protein [Sorangium sp. So ce1182]|uniref:hypothetical protein n=1 Tax=Sorangium sp. So ce1182 TaxID=3133334 RepID=UPI003F60F067
MCGLLGWIHHTTNAQHGKRGRDELNNIHVPSLDARPTINGVYSATSRATEPEAIGSFKIVRCKTHEHGADCMMKCADAGISCQAE